MSISAEVVAAVPTFWNDGIAVMDCWELTARHSFSRSTEPIQIPPPMDGHDGEDVVAMLLDLPGGLNERRVLFRWSGDLTVVGSS